MDGDYPNIRALFPEQTPIHAVVRTSDLAGAARRISLVAEAQHSPASEVHSGFSVAIDAGRGDEAQASETLQAHLSGDDITVAYNPPTSRMVLKVFRY